jgi:transcriptional regulator with PAS, ATPase and Fis domain
MDNLKEYDLTKCPSKIVIDYHEEIKLLNLNYLSLTSSFDKLKEKMFKNKNNKIEVDTFAKLKLLLSNFDSIINNIEDILVSVDKEGNWKLTNEDIVRINCLRESKLMFNTFFPYLLTYKLINDTLKTEDNVEEILPD